MTDEKKYDVRTREKELDLLDIVNIVRDNEGRTINRDQAEHISKNLDKYNFN